MERRSPHPDMKKRGLVTITLVCKCQITARNPPLHKNTKYICASNAGHGYNVGWMSYRHYNGGPPTDNPTAETVA